MPTAITLAHKLTKRLSEVRKQGILDWVLPDGKIQVTVLYEGYKPIQVDTVVVSTQHNPAVSTEQIRADVLEHVIKPVIPEHLRAKNTSYHINPTGRFAVGGPQGDCGLTGRKIIVDTYGGYGHHGGGAFSGKDPSKVDRSASYMARYLAKNIVAAGIADRAENSACLRDRGRRAGLVDGRYVWNRQDIRGEDPEDAAGYFQVDPAGNHRVA